MKKNTTIINYMKIIPIIFLFLAYPGCEKAHTIDTEQEQHMILNTLHQMDDWYKSDHYLIIKALYPEPAWTFTWLPTAKKRTTIGTSNAEIMTITGKKMDELKAAGLCTEGYLDVLQGRLESGAVMNTGMLLTGHQWGDNLYGILGVKEFLDYLPQFDAEGYNPVVMENETLSDQEINAWHTRRIHIESNTKATYTLLYTETGLGIIERQDAFFIISLEKENAKWMVSDISIKEAPRKEILAFYDKSYAARK